MTGRNQVMIKVDTNTFCMEIFRTKAGILILKTKEIVEIIYTALHNSQMHLKFKEIIIWSFFIPKTK